MGKHWPVIKQIFWINITLLAFAALFHLSACSWRPKAGKGSKEVWVYTSLNADTITDLAPPIGLALPNIKVNFYQASAEEIAAKVNAEMLSGGTKADIIITPDRFWLEDLAQKDFLFSYVPIPAQQISIDLRSIKGFYSPIGLSAIVIGYNSETILSAQAPKSFRDLGEEKWKGKISVGSPLASGTHFTALTVLQLKYGWEFVQRLKRNQILVEGGNANVLHRIYAKERPLGILLLDNIIRSKDKPTVKAVFPEDGVIFEANSAAIVKKPEGNHDSAVKLLEWLFSKDAQDLLIRSGLYSAMESYPPPAGAVAFSELKARAFHWDESQFNNVAQDRVRIKEKFAEMLFEKEP